MLFVVSKIIYSFCEGEKSSELWSLRQRLVIEILRTCSLLSVLSFYQVSLALLFTSRFESASAAIPCSLVTVTRYFDAAHWSNSALVAHVADY